MLRPLKCMYVHFVPMKTRTKKSHLMQQPRCIGILKEPEIRLCRNRYKPFELLLPKKFYTYIHIKRIVFYINHSRNTRHLNKLKQFKCVLYNLHTFDFILKN